MGSRTILNTVKSSRTGTLPCVRAIWGAWGLRPAAAREAEASVPALAEVLVDLALPEVLSRVPVLARPGVLAHLAPLLREADLPAVEVSLGADHRSFSAAMVGNLTSAATPRCSPVPRSGRRANRPPCPLT